MILAIMSSVALADDFVGQASVIDGDTLEMHGVRIRLWGIDAPESSQLCRGEDSLQYRCGAQAANDLDAFIARRPVNCVPVSLDPYGRTVATCSVAGKDLAEWLVRNGLALDWPQYSKGRYHEAQREAERTGQGLWKGSYVEPWLYRACIRASGKPPVRMTQMPILERSLRGANPQRVRQSPGLGRWLWRGLGDSR
ncbi:thermonuclease family protein [Bradyrhizobium hipponense]|uniref:thermonuclease family protein n=1 Tax=Bradyrhizobium hipponense TaxID=2605638 RepID=UPI003D31C0C8